MTVRILTGDCREVLRSLESESVNCVVTSPPYWGLRDYGNGDGGIGLEPTVSDHIAALVEVFREVRRVLRKDGTLWLNYGDAYAQSGNLGRKDTADEYLARRAAQYGTGRGNGQGPSKGAAFNKITDGLKPKDLIGLPWRIAFALQQPQYTGRIKAEADRAWLAAMVDGEGCFYVHRRKAGQHAGDGYYRTQDSFAPAFEVANTSEAVIQRCQQIVGGIGSVIRQEKDRRKPIYRWTVRCNDAKTIIREIYPHLVAKQHEARLCYGCESKGGTAAWEGLKLLHAGSDTTADFVPPPSCWEPGWYLRSDVIWSKPNPMPESVTDRPTRAHEYVFLLTKSPRYWYDADAIREPHATPEDERSNKTGARALRGQEAIRPRGNLEACDNAAERYWSENGRNARTVWNIATSPFPEAHFAAFPTELAERCIKAGCPTGGTVLDPFGGAGTVGLVADRLQRNAVLIELNPTYAEMARRRIERDAPMFAQIETEALTP